MSKTYKRNVFLHVNRFQERILLPFYVSCSIAFFSLLLWAFTNNPLIQHSGNFQALFHWKLNYIKFFAISSGFLIVVLFLLLIYWAYYISNKVLGGYERILQELDHVIDDKRHGPIKARDGDDFFNDLLKRINILIEKRKEEEGRSTQDHAEAPVKRRGLRTPKRAEEV